MKFNCAGCGNEFDWSERFPQGKDGYCRMCNKKYPEFEKWKQGMYAEFDRAKASVFAEKRLEYFGKKETVAERTQEYMTKPRGQVTAEQRAKLDHSIVVEGNVAADPLSSFSPDLQPIVKKARQSMGVNPDE
jgi:hypothetical protein